MNLEQLYNIKPGENIPDLRPGDNVRVSYKIKEANRERIQVLSGLVIRVRRGRGGGNFTIRRVASGVGVEHTFPLASPLIEKIEITRRGKVRRAKLYYIRRLSAREARLKERRERMLEAAGISEAEAQETAPASAE